MYKLLIVYIGISFFSMPGQAQNKIILTPVMSGLNIPVDIVFDHNNRMYVLEKTGKIKTPGSNSNSVFLDITDRVNSGANERGLLGMAFHPKYNENGYVFVNYTGGNGQTVIARYTRSANDSLIADPSSEKILMTISQPFNNHNAGDLNFGPDGYLYIAMGDGGSGGDPGNRSQNPKERLGKLLRIDVDTEATHYLIPPDNPYAGNADTLGEIWAMGLRNPWRFSFDKQNHDLWIADVGQRKWEEVNHIPFGKGAKYNFGWRCYEGFEKYDYSLCNDKTIFYPPVHVYANNSGGEGCSVTGGFVYRGENIPYLYGYYIYGDYCSGKIWRLKKDDCGNVKNEWVYTVGPNELSSFGQNNEGELFTALLGEGKVYLLSPDCQLTTRVDSVKNASCANAADGRVFFTIEGASDFDIKIQNAADPLNLAAGTYIYTVMEQGSACTQSGCFTIGAEPGLMTCTQRVKDTLCDQQKWALDPAICDLQEIDSLKLFRDGNLFYTGTAFPDSLSEGGIYSLVTYRGACSAMLDSFIDLTQLISIPDAPFWTLTDSTIIVKGDFIDYDYYEMYFQDSLWAVSGDGIFDLPEGVYGSFYFIGYLSDGPCTITNKSNILVLSGVKGTILSKPWFYPNPASSQIETKETGWQKVSLVDLQGRVLYEWSNHSSTLILPALANGNYWLKIYNQQQIFIQELMIAR